MEIPPELIRDIILFLGIGLLFLMILGALGPAGLGLGGIIPLRKWWPWPWRCFLLLAGVFIPLSIGSFVFAVYTGGMENVSRPLELTTLIILGLIMLVFMSVIISMYRQPEWRIEYKCHVENEAEAIDQLTRVELILMEGGDKFRRLKNTKDGWRISWWGQLMPVRGTGFVKNLARRSLDRTPRYSTMVESRIEGNCLRVNIIVVLLDLVMTDDYKPAWLWVRRHSRNIQRVMEQYGFEVIKTPPPLKGPSSKYKILNKVGP
ncbi:MAG: hypothetical protein JJU11_00420 [Candidatus Sumerlaeia bacterium]|nr:hypothetical protein [Candidatus Sumerlaeia bacterium]